MIGHEWGLLEWGITIIALLEFIILFYLGMTWLQNRRSKRTMGDFENNDFKNDEDDFNGDFLNMEKKPDLPGLGKNVPMPKKEPVALSIQEPSLPEAVVGPEVYDQLIVLKTKLECANLIIPDVMFGESDSMEVIKLKQDVMKVKKILNGLICRENS